ncbi:hypothetical protein [Mucilaginibacter auburnensis]|uniref:Uncharacterized protein n=1 Tax=Mucilaginibacter auburnensis TaxID=1457233 RepID=A0A2H9VVR4_9SPHI|nr:hypothetical protein [Mucilaginibacter auburnensis]PJJ84908.1 hypothetical protein CLV57_1930 [Mucilaginibacter auburnensis]
MANYLISSHPEGDIISDTIHDSETKLKVRAINLLQSVFTPSKGEVRFFVTTETEKIAFETKGYRKHRQDLILHMISWYCAYAGWVNSAKIHLTLPGV